MSRQIDALVAMHVTDWAKPGELIGSFAPGGKPCPHYSTDIAVAWGVAEKFSSITIHKGSQYWVNLGDDFVNVRDLGDFEATDAYLPIAICLAALKAKGIEVDDA